MPFEIAEDAESSINPPNIQRGSKESPMKAMTFETTMGQDNELLKACSAVSLTKNTRPSSALRKNLFLVKPLTDNKKLESESEP